MAHLTWTGSSVVVVVVFRGPCCVTETVLVTDLLERGGDIGEFIATH